MQISLKPLYLQLMVPNEKYLETEKQSLLDSAELTFGKEYFEKLERLSADLLMREEEEQDYIVTINYQGAFHAIQE